MARPTSPDTPPGLNSKPDRIYSYILAGLIIVGALIRLVNLDGQPFWYDELYSAWASKLDLATLLEEVAASGHPPLYYLVLHFVHEAGSSLIWVRLTSIISGLVSIWLVYAIGVSLFSRKAALVGAALATLSPTMVWYARDATYYGFLMVLTLAAFFFLVRSAQTGHWYYWVAYALAIAGAAATYSFTSILIMASGIIYWFLPLRKKGDRQLVIFGSVQALALVFYIYMLGAVKSTNSMVAISFPDLAGLARQVLMAPFVLGFGRTGQVFALMLEGGGSPVIILVVLAIALALVALAIFAVRRYWAAEPKLPVIALALFTFMIVFGPIFVYALMRGKTDYFRFYIWGAPFVMLLIGWGVSLLPRRRMVVALSVIAAGMLLPLAYQQFLVDQGDLESVAERIRREKQEGDMVLCFPANACVITMDFFDPESPPVRGGWVLWSDPERAYIPDGDSAWDGYRAQCGRVSELQGCEPSGDVPYYSGAALEARMDALLADTGRIWLYVHDQEKLKEGNEPAYPAPTIIGDYLAGNDWQLTGEWSAENSLRISRLYER